MNLFTKTFYSIVLTLSLSSSAFASERCASFDLKNVAQLLTSNAEWTSCSVNGTAFAGKIQLSDVEFTALDENCNGKIFLKINGSDFALESTGMVNSSYDTHNDLGQLTSQKYWMSKGMQDLLSKSGREIKLGIDLASGRKTLRITRFEKDDPAQALSLFCSSL